MKSESTDRKPLHFFCLLFLVSAPFWFYGVIASTEVLPHLPVSAAMVVCPTIAGSFLIWRTGKAKALWKYFRSVAYVGGSPLWVWPVAVGTMPLVMLLSGLALIAVGKPLPKPEITFTQTATLFALFMIAAVLEELGWTGYAAQPMIKKRGWLVTGLIIGTIAAIWHVIPLLQADRALSWIAWWAVGTVCRRIIILWLYVESGKRVLVAALFHAMSNVSWMLFPVMGSHYDPVSTAIILPVPVVFLASRAGTSRDLGHTSPAAGT